jgi:thioredoxin-dependent peroxiredoxin
MQISSNYPQQANTYPPRTTINCPQFPAAAGCSSGPRIQNQPFPPVVLDTYSPSRNTHPLQPGQTAPSFLLPDQNGKPVHLYQALQKGPVVLFFYPKDNSPLCVKQVQAFREAYPYFQQMGASVFGISSDSAKSHQQFIASQRLPFPLLSDTNEQVRKQYGAQSLGGVIPARVTFVIAPQTGQIKMAYSSQFNIQEHIQHALQALQQPASVSRY